MFTIVLNLRQEDGKLLIVKVSVTDCYRYVSICREYDKIMYLNVTSHIGKLCETCLKQLNMLLYETGMLILDGSIGKLVTVVSQLDNEGMLGVTEPACYDEDRIIILCDSNVHRSFNVYYKCGLVNLDPLEIGDMNDTVLTICDKCQQVIDSVDRVYRYLQYETDSINMSTIRDMIYVTSRTVLTYGYKLLQYVK